MTGEMSRASLAQDISEGAYALHVAAAKALSGTVQPFDQYQGPYVLIGAEVRATGIYAPVVRGLGVRRLWLIGDDEGGPVCRWYNEATETESVEFWWNDIASAVDAALAVA